MKRLLDWMEARTRYRGLAREALYENIPGGSRWRYVWGSTLMFTFFVQVVTGCFLWMAYSPSSQTAWESVYYIQYEMAGGWLLRGIHHYTAHAMTVLLVLHLMQVVIDGAYKAPREVNFWFGLVLLQLVLALSLTGYLLPWDQKGFWATKVATNLVAIIPVIGGSLQKIIIGGSEYGHHTLTRFFALHAGVVPGLIVLLIVGHIYLFRKHGITSKEPKKRPDAAFWPDQVFKDTVACLAVMAVVLVLILWPRLFGNGESLGVDLGAPADPSEAYAAARPDWYFLFLFQFLKYFHGRGEIWGAIIIPGLLMGVLFLAPFIGQWRLGHRFNLGFLGALLLGAALLTYLAIAEDRSKPEYLAARQEAEENAKRVKLLAHAPTGIPSAGAVTLLRTDPLHQGPKLFARHCASCHRFDGHDALGQVPQEPPAAADLKNFASREWLSGLLDPARIVSLHYFGGTKFREGKMVKFIQKDVVRYSPDQKENLRKVIAALSAQARLKSQAQQDQRGAAMIAEGIKLLSGEIACTDCHSFLKKDPDATAPDLTAYGSREWLMGMISNPSHEDYYGKKNDRMPAFGTEKILNQESIGLLADWLRGEWYQGENRMRTRPPAP